MCDNTPMRIVIWSPLHLIEPLLGEAGLPTDDIGGPAIRWIVAMEESEGAPLAPCVVGCGGLQWLDERTVLVRSLAVAPDRRSEGIGGAIHDRLVEEAIGEGIDSLYLLTTAAAEFFTRRGWRIIDRGDAPDVIKETAEYSTLCPDRARLLRYTR